MSDLYLPTSYTVRQQHLEAVEKANIGTDFGDSLILGPAGQLSSMMRGDTGGGRSADKAMYKYLYMRHPFVYACVELICQTAAQDRHTYPASDTPGGKQISGGKPKQPTVTERVMKALDDLECELGPDALIEVRKALKPREVPQSLRNRLQQDEDDADEDDFGPGSKEPLDGMEFLEHFFAEVNMFESFNELLQSVYRDVLIYGEAFILKQREGATVEKGNVSAAGRDDRVALQGGRVDHVQSDKTMPVLALHRIPSVDTFAVAGSNGYPSVYRQKAEGGGFREYAVEDVIFFRLPDPDNPCHGISPMEALDLSLATDMSAAKYNEAYFRNGAKAGMVFAAQGLSEPEIRRNKQWIKDEYVKPENAHTPMLLLGNIQMVRDGNKAQNDMEFLQLRRFTREEICAVYSVPMSKLLHTSDGMGSTGKASDDMTFRADTVGPLQTKVYETINRQLMKTDFPDFPLLIPPRQEKIRLDLLEAAKSLVAVGGTGNESRAILHLPAIDHDTMELPLFLVPGIKALVTDADAKTAAKTGMPLTSGSTTDAGRADRTSKRGKNGQRNARAKGGVGMKVRKSESDLIEETLPE
jgi:phage portal protein BeeE